MSSNLTQSFKDKPKKYLNFEQLMKEFPNVIERLPEGTWPDHEFVLVLETRTANQNTVSNKYFVLIGQFWSRSTKLLLESFMTVSR